VSGKAWLHAAPARETRDTRQRQVIIETLRGLRTHPNADEVYRLVKRRLPRISLATVYRNLERLSEEGVIQKVYCAGQRRFDGDPAAHCHVRCECCGRIDDIECQVPVHLRKPFRHRTGYRITGHHFEFLGLCPRCQGKR